MKVCMLAYTFYENDGRVRRYAEELVSQGCEVDVVSLRRRSLNKKTQINGVDVYCLQERTMKYGSKFRYLFEILIFSIRSFLFISKVEINDHYDLVHVHNVPDFLVFASIIAKFRGAKIILDIHDIVPEFYAGKFKEDNKSLFYRSLLIVEKLSISYSDYVIVSNHLWEQKLISRSVRSDKCSTIINYPDQKIFKPSLRLHDEVESNKEFVVMYPGTCSWHQGLDVAIRAMHRLRDREPEIVFHLYGNGPTKNSLVELVASLGLEGKVVFKEPLPIEKMAEKIASSSLGIVPKRAEGFGGEAFSTKILEFMSFGVPVVVSNTKIDKYYFSEETVRFFESENDQELSDRIVEIKNNKNLRKKLSENCLQYIGINNWGNQKHRYFEILNKIGISRQEMATK